jgi:anti-anti-sigma regulatory factor
MLRVTVKEERGIATLHLEGVLAGPWVQEVERCWQDTPVCPEHVIVDLSEVTSLDGSGRELLEEMHAAGTQLRGEGLLVEYILEQIRQKQAV